MRVNLSLSGDCGDVLDRLCAEKDLTRPQVVRQALGIMQVIHDEAKTGRYVGTSRDREVFDTVIVTPL